MENRVRFIGTCFLLASIVLIGRLFFWQIVKGEDLSQKAKLQQVGQGSILAKRGNILSADNTWLAASIDKWLLYATKPQLTDSAETIANKISPLLIEEDLEDNALMDETIRLQNLLSRDDLVWIPLAHGLSEEKKSNIFALSIDGLGFEQEEGRYYPEASSSAHILGFVGKDDEGNPKGYFGLEGYYDYSLKGKPGFKQVELDAVGNPLIFGDSKQVNEKQGIDLVTHINKAVQIAIEEELNDAIEKYGAKSGSVIVMNPRNGAIIGMTSFPSYDPDKYSEYGDQYFKNPVISDSYEPGSIFKPIIMSAGLDAGVIKPDTKCEICDQPYKIDKYFIKTWDNTYHPESTMTEVIQNSDNVGMVFVGQKLSADKMYDYLDRFGFGHLTEIDLQGEFSPRLREEGTWNKVDLATTTFGQGIAVTPIQMIKAVATIANDGVSTTPQVVDKLKTGSWEEDVPTEIGEQVISKKAADEITEMMVNAVGHGEAKWAVPRGYEIAGKTGTAQIPVEGHYDEEKTIASFVGFAPPEDPKMVMLVMLREPQSSTWASETAAPLWFDIAKKIFPLLGVKPGS